MAKPFQIQVNESAEADLQYLSAYAQRIIIDGMEVHLRRQPTIGTRRIKSLRANPVAGWEMRLGDYRVLYDADEINRVVTVQVVGEKRGSRLVVQGKEFVEHESDRT